MPAGGVTLRFRTRQLTIDGDEVRDIVDEARRRDAPFATQRERFRQSLIRRAYDRYTRGVAIELDESDFGAALLGDTESRKAIDGCWRSVSPVALVRSLLTRHAFLARAAAGVLGSRAATDVAAEAEVGRRVDRPRPAAHRRGGGVRQGRTPPLRARCGRRSAGPVADAAAHARPSRAAAFDDGARRPCAGDGARVAVELGSNARAPRTARQRAAGRPHDGVPTARRVPRAREPAAPDRRAGRRAVPLGPRRRRSARRARVRARGARGRSCGTRARARQGVRNRRSDRGRRTRRRVAASDRGPRCRARRAGGGHARPAARRAVCPVRKRAGVRRGDRGRAGGDRSRGTARRAPPLRRPDPGGTAPCARPFSTTARGIGGQRRLRGDVRSRVRAHHDPYRERPRRSRGDDGRAVGAGWHHRGPRRRQHPRPPGPVGEHDPGPMRARHRCHGRHRVRKDSTLGSARLGARRFHERQDPRRRSGERRHRVRRRERSRSATPRASAGS